MNESNKELEVKPNFTVKKDYVEAKEISYPTLLDEKHFLKCWNALETHVRNKRK